MSLFDTDDGLVLIEDYFTIDTLIRNFTYQSSELYGTCGSKCEGEIFKNDWGLK